MERVIKVPKVSLVFASFNRSELMELSFLSIIKNKPSFPLEIIVINDGFENDNTKKVCDKYKDQLDIKYYFSGQRNKEKPIQTNSAVPNNIAIRKATGDILLLTCPEIVHLNDCIEKLVQPIIRNKKRMTIPTFMYYDKEGVFTEDYKNGEFKKELLSTHDDFVKMPYLMGVWKSEIIRIGGYDEDFIGYGTEDNDLIARLQRNGCRHFRTKAEIIHLHHSNTFPIIKNTLWENPAWIYNRKLLEERKMILNRNVGKDWGNIEMERKGLPLFTSVVTIPKILHLYWDKSPMSWLQTQTVTTFHKKNPDWEIRIYTPIQPYIVPGGRYVPDYTGADFFYLIKKLKYVQIKEIDMLDYGIDPKIHNILQSDIFRYKILYECGGLWSDFDVLWLKSMDYLPNIETEGKIPVISMGTMVCRYQEIKHHNISVLITVPKHPLYKFIIEKTDEIQKKNIDRNKLLHQQLGTNLFDELFKLPEDEENQFIDVARIPYKTFYPYAIYDLRDLYERVQLSNLEPDTMCIHWFNGAPLSKKYINAKELNPNCSMTKILTLIDKGIL